MPLTEMASTLEAKQALLRDAWTQGRAGYLPAWEEAKAWALREMWRSDHDSDYGLVAYVAQKLKKIGGGNPVPQAVGKLYSKMDSDTDWFPGKSSQERHGPLPVLSGAKRSQIVQSAMSMKKKGVEPTYEKIVATCPNATKNAETNRPVSKKRIYSIMKESCFDESPEQPWEHKPRYSKVALTDDMMKKREAFAKHVESWRHSKQWYYNNVIWTDICNSILPRTEKKSSEQALARKGKRGWISPGCELFSCNLVGKKEAVKQNSWDCMRVWWAPVLMRGKLHVEVLDDQFPGETSAGAASLVQKVRAAVNVRFQAGVRQPKIIFVDRGKGFFIPATGKITSAFQAALAENGFEAIMGDNASKQPGNLQELMLHETAVAWLRKRLAETVPRKAWLETRDAFSARLKTCCEGVNRDLDVEGLCGDFLKRVAKLRSRQGGRLSE